MLNMNFKFGSWASWQSNQKEAKLSLSKSGFQSFLQLHSKVSYRELYIKGTLWYGKQCPWQYHWTNTVKMFYMVTLSSLFRWRYQIKILPSETDIAMGCFCNTHHFYTEGFLHMD